ncbi:MAG: HigA family addiction module antitoxin [Proteobacteria bacterium]|nr:HigA family addiction module antitoxin [Pseudomonadota bacterium]MDA1057812.1 HigA family addiction module antitoxin [Pseudomonadota bacterium]
MAPRKLKPIPPGEVLHEEFMKPAALSANALARSLDVPPNRISGIVRGDRSITADTALRLGRYFTTTPGFWLNLQTRFDLETAQDSLAGRLKRIVPRRAA